ncbi:collagen alpha-1(III) chain-like [Accipiter gentilis]|uniref:collagen alpha-1(III) chain-like n=1 Tax=Astur gentilis TaxID=8957 RepID=UPI0021100C11|nr:collagen alpha-1(III) chain-like [Accipiter gentilis]
MGGGGSAPLAVQSEGRSPIGRGGIWARETRLQAAVSETRSGAASPGSAQQPGLRRAAGKPGTDQRGGAEPRAQPSRSRARAADAPQRGTARCWAGGGAVRGGGRGPERGAPVPAGVRAATRKVRSGSRGAGLPPHYPPPPLNPLGASSRGPGPAAAPGSPARPRRHSLYLRAGGAARPGPGAATATASLELERLPGAVSDSAAGRGFRGGPGYGTAPRRGYPGWRPPPAPGTPGRRPSSPPPIQAPPPCDPPPPPDCPPHGPPHTAGLPSPNHDSPHPCSPPPPRHPL